MKLLNNQQQAFDKLLEFKVGALFMDAGAGKTRVALELVNSVKDVGFIAKAFSVRDDDAFNMIEDSFDVFKYRGKSNNIVLKIEDYLYDISLTNEQKQRVKTLLKKGFKKLMHVIEEIFDTENDLSIKNQIALLRETQQHNQNNYLKMVEKNGKETTDYAFKLLEATIKTLEEQQEIQNIFKNE